MRSIWEEIEEEFPDLKTEYFDADLNSAEVAEHAVEKIPTFIFLDAQNQEIIRLSGAQNKSDLIEKVKANLDK